MATAVAEQEETGQLSGLLSDNSTPSEPSVHDIRIIPVDQIFASSLNPRSIFDEDSINDLAESIRQNGLIELITVCEKSPERFDIVAGERRFRAIKKLGWQIAQVIVKPNMDDVKHTAMALVENLIRDPLSPIEEAKGFSDLRSMGWDVTAIAKAMSRSQPAISNSLRLLRLPEVIRDLVETKKLSASHGVALVTLGEKNEGEAIRLANAAVDNNWSTKHLENIANGIVKTIDSELNPSLSLQASVPVNANQSTPEATVKPESKSENVPLATHQVAAPDAVTVSAPTPTRNTPPPAPTPTGPTSHSATNTPSAAPTNKSTPVTQPSTPPAQPAATTTPPATATETKPAETPAAAPSAPFVNVMIPADLHGWLIEKRLTTKAALLRLKDLERIIPDDVMQMVEELAAHLSDKNDRPVDFPEALESTVYRRCMVLGLRPVPETVPVGTPEDEAPGDK